MACVQRRARDTSRAYRLPDEDRRVPSSSDQLDHSAEAELPRDRRPIPQMGGGLEGMRDAPVANVYLLHAPPPSQSLSRVAHIRGAATAPAHILRKSLLSLLAARASAYLVGVARMAHAVWAPARSARPAGTRVHSDHQAARRLACVAAGGAPRSARRRRRRRRSASRHGKGVRGACGTASMEGSRPTYSLARAPAPSTGGLLDHRTDARRAPLAAISACRHSAPPRMLRRLPARTAACLAPLARRHR